MDKFIANALHIFETDIAENYNSETTEELGMEEKDIKLIANSVVNILEEQKMKKTARYLREKTE